MKNRFTKEGPGPLPSERRGARIGLALLFVCGLAAAMLAAPGAGAQEAQRIAQAQDPEPRPAASDAPAEPEPPAKPEPPARPKAPTTSGIEEIVVFGAESQAARDFEAGDSVTGFGAEDLAALGAQDISDLASFTPNLEIVTAGATTPTFFIRGVGLNDFNPNSTGSVAVYRDDVAINTPALQLATLYDVEAVNILRGPQGTGPARNASAGAIKMYSRKPTGNFGGFLRSELGNFGSRDFEGAIEAPIFEDLLASRFAFRLRQRDGTMKNRCAGAPEYEDRVPVPRPPVLIVRGKLPTDPPWSMCGEPVDWDPGDPAGSISDVPPGLPSRVNDIGNWAARGTLLFQPTLDMSWLLSAHGSRRDELTRLGQSIGTGGFYCKDGNTDNCDYGGQPDMCVAPPENVGNPCALDSDCNSAPHVNDGMCTRRINAVLGGPQGKARAGGYQAPEIRERLKELAPCYVGVPGTPGGATCILPGNREASDAAKQTVAEELVDLDDKPWEGDFNICGGDNYPCDEHSGRTTNDTWGAYVKGDIVLPWGMQLTSVSGYDTYDRLLDIDLDFSPETLFQIRTDDEGWQAVQDLRLQGQAGDESFLRWDIGGWLLREHLDVNVRNDLGIRQALAAGQRIYTQDVLSAAGYFSLAFDFWDRFTLEGGLRYNWEQKKLDYLLVQSLVPLTVKLNNVWKAPTGTVRLTYRFRDDTHVFWKYTRGWKPGTYNATSAVLRGVETGVVFPNISVADPEVLDAFETGVRGSWFEGRLGLDLSIFYYDYKDYQIFTAQQFATGQPEFVIINAPGAEVYGAELDAVSRPWGGAYLNVRVGWLQSQFLDFVQLQQEQIFYPGVGIVAVDRTLQNTGNALLNSPRFKVSITAEQTLPLGRWGSVSARYDGVWTDTTYYDATQGEGLPDVENRKFLPKDTIGQRPFWVHNLRLAYRPPGLRLEIAAWVRNLTNEAYKTFAFDGSTFNKTTIYFVGDPRTYGGSLVLNF